MAQVNDGRSEAVERETDETDDRMGGGAGSGDDTPSKGWLNTLALGCLIDCQPRWMAELRIQKAAIRDWRPADRVKVWSCLQKLAEEEGEENHRLDNPFNIWACSCALRRSILSEARVQLRAEGGREVAVVVHAVFLFKVLRVMDQMTNQIEGL
ncbi:hypothetical protein BY996DRAFT_6564627 [Phakopsora pachyrhizi]|nr:hypothetical protein BY996DRAFT_6564627 [Phakopsora pachyrhizi]